MGVRANRRSAVRVGARVGRLALVFPEPCPGFLSLGGGLAYRAPIPEIAKATQRSRRGREELIDEFRTSIGCLPCVLCQRDIGSDLADALLMPQKGFRGVSPRGFNATGDVMQGDLESWTSQAALHHQGVHRQRR